MAQPEFVSVSAACSPTEKEKVRLVAHVRGTTESKLLRALSLESILAEADRIQALRENGDLFPVAASA